MLLSQEPAPAPGSSVIKAISCLKCSADVPAGAIYCSHCGTKVVVSPFTVAPQWRRLLNFVIDSGIIFVLWAHVLGSSELKRPLNPYILFLLYYFLFELVGNRTVGKVLTRTKVVSANGGRPSFLQVLGRSFSRCVPFEPCSFGGRFPYGWHDNWTGTAVVLDALTSKDVEAIDFREVRKNRSSILFIIPLFLIVVSVLAVRCLGKSVAPASTKPISTAPPSAAQDQPWHQGAPILSYESAKGFSVTLPDANWSFMSRADFEQGTTGNFPDAEVFLASKALGMGGIIIPERVAMLPQGASALDRYKKAEDIFRNQISEMKALIVREDQAVNGFDLHFTSTVNGITYRYIKSFRALQNWAFSTLMWAEERQSEALWIAHRHIVNSLREHEPTRLTAAEIFKASNDAVVLVRLYSEDGKLVGLGSGFNIHPSGTVITNAHVLLGGGSYVDVVFPNHGTYQKVGVAGIADPEKDTAVLVFNAKNLPSITIGASKKVEVGDKIFVIGNPEGLLNTLSEGIVSGVRGESVVPYYQTALCQN